MNVPELKEVEEPFLNQLASMGWKIVTGSVDFPSVTGRESFREVLLEQDLRAAIRPINLGDGARSGSPSTPRSRWGCELRVPGTDLSRMDLSSRSTTDVHRLLETHDLSR